MTEKLHLRDEQLRELLHLLSHDVRNPLAAIVTNLEFARRLINRASADPDLVDSIEDSVIACDVLRRIVSNFDLLVKGREVTVTVHEVDVVPVVRDVLRRCEGRASQADMTLTFEESDATPRAMVDKSLLMLALENLLANSIQHAPRGSHVRVLLTEDASWAKLTVCDPGQAIAEDLRDIAVGVEGHTANGRREGTRYGRGLGLLAANAACAASGIELTVGGQDGDAHMALDIPLVNMSATSA